MAKSNARLVEANEKVVGLVARGYEVDVESKNLAFEDKGIKKMLADELSEAFGDDSSIAVKGGDGMAVLTKSEKYKVKGDADAIARIAADSEVGYLDGAVSVDLTLNVPEADREKAAAILKAAGINATFTKEVSVDPEKYRALSAGKFASVERVAAKQNLDAVVEQNVTYRITYSKA